MDTDTDLVHRPEVAPGPGRLPSGPSSVHGLFPSPERTDPERTNRTRVRRRHATRHRRRAAWVMGVVVLVVAVAFGVRVHDQLHRTDRSLADARASLHRASLQLAADRGAEVGVARAADTTGRVLAASENTLDALQTRLSGAEADDYLAGINISDLVQCLAGVEQALNQLSLSDPEGAFVSLTAVSPQCTAAQAAT